MFDYNLINEALYEYLEGANLGSFEFVKSLNNIILRNPVKRKEPFYNKKIEMDTSVLYAYNFFLSLSEEYASYFEKKLNEGTVYFSEYFDFGHSYYDLDLKKGIVKIPITNSIQDSFVLVHEILHDMNLNFNGCSDCRMLFTETISALGELLYKDFLVKYNFFPKDNYKVVINLFRSMDLMAKENDFEIKLSEQFIQNGYVSIDFLKNLYSKYDNETVQVCISELLEENRLNIDYTQRYIVAAILSCYMYDRIKQDSKKLSEFMDINSMLNDVFFETILDYIDLRYDEDNLSYVLFTKNSLETLEKCYKKELKLI